MYWLTSMPSAPRICGAKTIAKPTSATRTKGPAPRSIPSTTRNPARIHAPAMMSRPGPSIHATSPCKNCWKGASACRSEEHTSELQSHHDLVCRLLLEKKKPKYLTELIVTCLMVSLDNTGAG